MDINQRLVGMLIRSGVDKAVDMDELLKREALDVIGQLHRRCCPASLLLDFEVLTVISFPTFTLWRLDPSPGSSHELHGSCSRWPSALLDLFVSA